MKKLKRPDPNPRFRVKLRKPFKPYVTLKYHEDAVKTDPFNAWVAEAFVAGGILDKAGSSNWYGDFSSGRCGIIGSWDLYRETHNTAGHKPWRIDKLFQKIERGRFVDIYPQLETTKGNSNLGTCGLGFDATPENIRLVKRVLTQAGYEIREEDEGGWV
jgi:hypothetical protein